MSNMFNQVHMQCSEVNGHTLFRAYYREVVLVYLQVRNIIMSLKWEGEGGRSTGAAVEARPDREHSGLIES